MSSDSFLATLFKSPSEKLKSALAAQNEDLVWKYLKKYSHILHGDIRSQIWLMLSPATKLRCCPKFEDVIRYSPNFRTLQNDMERTWGLDEDEILTEDELSSLRSDLKLVLISFWKDNHRVSYCQGLHSICNVIHHEMCDLDATLRVLTGVVEELRVGGLYIHEPPLTALQHCADLIFDYLSAADAALYDSMDKLDFVNILAHWFMSGFVGVLSRNLVLCLFDGLICDGIIVFFAAALAILRLRRSEIISAAKDPKAQDGSLLLGLGLGSGIIVSPHEEKHFKRFLDWTQTQLLVVHNFDEKIETSLFHDEGCYSGSSSSLATSRSRAFSDVSTLSLAESSVSPLDPPALANIEVEREEDDEVEEVEEAKRSSHSSLLSWLFRPRTPRLVRGKQEQEDDDNTAATLEILHLTEDLDAVGLEDVFGDDFEP